jgi:modulator of FtsH protease HflC
MNQAKMLAPIGLIVLALVVYASTFVVSQWEVAIKLRLGEIVDSEYDPGLHWLFPVLNNVKKFDGRIQTLDSRPERFLTIEKKDVIVDSFAKWRITNPGQFFRSTGGDSGRTARLLSERVNTALRDEFGKRTIQEVVSEDRLELMTTLTKKIDANAAELGIEVVDVRVKKIDLPPEVSESVYQRMRAERERVARDLRAKGSEAAERLSADADRQRTVTLAEAYKESEQLRGEGDAKAAEIYANAFNQNKEFFSFHRSLNAYRTAFGGGGNMMVLQPESDFFRYFKENTLSASAPARNSQAVSSAAPESSATPVPQAPAPAPESQAPALVPEPQPQAAAPAPLAPVAPTTVDEPPAPPGVAPPPFSVDR